jgi:RNA polymerase sigma-70 factor (ECF subfamily)
MDALQLKENTQPGPIALEAWIPAAVRGDRDAFEVLMTARFERTVRIALAVLGSREDARDAVQDAWLTVWRALPSLHDHDRFDAWLDRIVVNSCKMARRRRGPVREIAVSEGFDVQSREPGPDQVGERLALEDAFDRLSVEQRTILVLHHLEQRPLAHIAGVLGIPIGTAKSRLHAARSALERALEGER